MQVPAVTDDAAGAPATVYVGRVTKPVTSPVKPLSDTTGPEKLDWAMKDYLFTKDSPGSLVNVRWVGLQGWFSQM